MRSNHAQQSHAHHVAMLWIWRSQCIESQGTCFSPLEVLSTERASASDSGADVQVEPECGLQGRAKQQPKRTL